MSFSQLILQRYSVRKFDSRPIPGDALSRILEAGQLAPTACNNQPQRILVLEGDSMKNLSGCTPCLYGQSIALVLCYDKTESWKSKSGREIGDVDTTLVLAQMMYQAQELGIGSLIVGIYKEDLLRERFHIPNHYEIVSLLMLGYPAEDCQPHPKLHSERKPLVETVYYDTF